MGRKTISTRYKDWIKEDPFWAYTCLVCFGLVFVGLMMHLAIIDSWLRPFGLVVLLVGDIGAIAITVWKKKWWWFSFYLFITAGVIGWEIASYFFGG